MGPINRGVSADIFYYFTILHEYGHLLALGDTYRIPGVIEWTENQPPSVMNGQNFPPEAFTADDQWGLWAVLYSLKTGKRGCQGFGKEVPMTKNQACQIMCDPRSEATYVHRNISDILDNNVQPAMNASERIPNPGKWRYEGVDPQETWMQIEHIPEREDQFRAVFFVNGSSPSPSGALYECSNSMPNKCALKSVAGYEIEVFSNAKIKLKTPQLPNGIEVELVPPPKHWWDL